MDHQLVLRFPAAAVSDHTAMIRLEAALSRVLDDGAEAFDGHDFSLDEADLFILCADPARTFGRIKPILAQKGLLNALTAAHGPVEEDAYTVLWPPENLGRVFACG